MTPDLLRRFVARAIAAPSVHNVQPARWRIEGEDLVLLEDPTRRLTVGDPTGHDAAISLGAAAEGAVLAASAEGYAAQVLRGEGESVARLHFVAGGAPDPLADWLDRRASWRGALATPSQADRDRAAALAGEDRTIITDPAGIMAVAALLDRASYGFMRDDAFRGELVSWMRLSSRHPRWARDGLNAAAMKLSRIEAWGAGLVLGPLFRPLAALGLAPAILSEAKAFGNAAGVVLFHRPADEDPFDSGRAFHRLWLEVEAAGFGANVLAALADDKTIAADVAQAHGISEGRRLVSALRIGIRDGEGFPRARLPLDEVIVG